MDFRNRDNLELLLNLNYNLYLPRFTRNGGVPRRGFGGHVEVGIRFIQKRFSSLRHVLRL